MPPTTTNPRLWRLLTLLLLAVSALAAQQGPAPIVIPDSTQLRLRLAQPLSARALILVGKSARERAPVRLAVAGEVRIGGLLVIARGAMAQAIVTNVYQPGSTLSATGIELRLDWVASVNGVEIPIRAAKDGVRGPFMLEVIAIEGGYLARPSRHRGVRTLATAGMSTLYERDAAPAGTRMYAFVDGDIRLDAAEIEQAQARFPAPNPQALLSIYRLKGRGGARASITSDGKPAGDVGERQYITLELPPGKHMVAVSGSKPVEITVAGGEEYYLRLNPRGFHGWELNAVNAFEGEDGVASAELVQKQ